MRNFVVVMLLAICACAADPPVVAVEQNQLGEENGGYYCPYPFEAACNPVGDPGACTRACGTDAFCPEYTARDYQFCFDYPHTWWSGICQTAPPGYQCDWAGDPCWAKTCIAGFQPLQDDGGGL